MRMQLEPNPDDRPGASSSGYQRQNYNMFIARTGLDTTSPYETGTEIVIPRGGYVEINGTLYGVRAEDIRLPKPVPGRAYWVEVGVPLEGNGTADVRLVERPGEWVPSRNGCYTSNSSRTLNWVSGGALANIPTTGAEWSSPATRGMHESGPLGTGWKFVSLASGAGGAGGADMGTVGGTATPGQPGAGGGGSTAADFNAAVGVFFYRGGGVRAKIGGNGQIGFNGGGGGRSGASGNNTGGHGGGGGGGGFGGGEESMFFADGFSLAAEKVPPGVAGPGGAGSPGGSIGSGTAFSERGGDGGGGGDFGLFGLDGTRGDDGTAWQEGTPGIGGLGGNARGVRNGLNGTPGTGSTNAGGGGGGAGGGAGRNGWERYNFDGASIPGGFCNVFALGN